MAPRLAWAMFGLTVGCVVAQTLILADQRSLLSRRTIENGWPIISVACVIGALFGALIVARTRGTGSAGCSPSASSPPRWASWRTRSPGTS